jgi:putative transposase
MVKLNNKKIKWLVDQVIKYNRNPKDFAPTQNITVRRVQQLVKEYKETKKYPKLNKSRRPKTFLNEIQKKEIDKAFLETRLNARMLYFELKKRGFQIAKNKLYSHMKSKGWVIPNQKKQKQRKRCRYERKHSGSLIHGDWHRTSLSHPHCILWLDDASRKIITGNEFDSETSENSIKTLKNAINYVKSYDWAILQVNTDRGPQFFNNHKNVENLTNFQKFLIEQNIQHVVSRRNNPQTNGKLERRWLEYDKHRWRFKTLNEWIEWHNNRLTTSLDIESFETPNIAFIRKLPNLLALFLKRLE